MKICLVNNLYKPYVRGGAEVVVETIADGLKNNGYDVVIITTKPLFKRFEIKDLRLKIYYISGLYFNLDKIPKFLRLFWHFVDMFDVGSYLAVRKILKKEKPDVVMTHNLKGVGYLVPAAIRSLKIKHIHTLHDIQLLHPSGLMFYGEEKLINGIFSKFYQSICRWLFCGPPLTKGVGGMNAPLIKGVGGMNAPLIKGVGGICSPDIIISPSKWLLEEHINRGFFKDSKKAVLPNPMNVMNQESGIRNQGEGVFKFLYVGLIEEHKGILFLIKAFKKLKAPADIGVGRFELLIVGDGSKLKQAQELVGDNKNIKLLGRVKNNEVMELMRSSDCLIMPSLCYENSPTVIYEAMAAGLPVIASRIGGVPELVSDNLLFEPRNEEDLIDKMKWVVEHRKGTRGAGKRKNFGVESYVKKITQLL